MNILELIVILLTAALALAGFRKGFVRKLASMLSLVLSVALVSQLLPYVTEFLKTDTPLYGYIVEQCESAVIRQAVSGQSSSPGSDDSKIGREEIRDLLEQYGYDSSVIDTLSDEELAAYVQQYLEYAEGSAGTDAGGLDLEIDRNTQMEIIDSLPVPQLLKDLLTDYNNDEGYSRLHVSDFQNYITEFLASAVLNVISFVVSVILVQLLLWGAITALNLLAHIPVISIVNRLAGLALGLVQALFLLWIFFLLLTMLQTTEAGLLLMDLVEQSSLLSWLYESNLFLRIVLQTAAIF